MAEQVGNASIKDLVSFSWLKALLSWLADSDRGRHTLGFLTMSPFFTVGG